MSLTTTKEEEEEEEKKTLAPIIALEGNCSLKQATGDGFKVADFITEEKIVACDNLVKKAIHDFFIDAEADLKRLEELTRALAEPLNADEENELQRCAYNIKTMAKVLGFTLITEICIHLVNSLHSKRLSIPKQRALLQKLVDTLRLACNHHIRDDGGVVGKEILMNLRAHISAE
jgi:hypothetical protein